jgi:hypothetical protein
MSEMRGGRFNWKPIVALAALMALTVVVYWPALYGGFIFDDRYYVEGTDVHVTSLHLGDWVRAALSQAGTNQFRALSMLTFAANYYFTGLDPFWLKLTNVAIHLANGWLMFLLLRELFRLAATVRGRASDVAARDAMSAAVITGLWLLLPINLTGVAYVSQRLESLANLFVLLGLFWYLRARRRHYIGQCSGAMLSVSLLVCLLLGFSAKESAVMLPLYTACAELAVCGFRDRDGRWCRPALYAHAVFLILPLIAGLIYISPWLVHPITSFRPFTTYERLLTEARVLIDYIEWTLLPNLNSLTLFHDDLPISHGLLDPPTTLASIVALLALSGIALALRGSRPLFCLGILWFFAGHALTATVIPLELVFEHRNYFPSLGLLLAAASLIALEPGLRWKTVKTAVAVGCLALCAFTTFLRAEEWSRPLRLAYSEALKRPDSPRAQYELARTLIEAAGDDVQSPLLGESAKTLERIAYRPDSGIAPLQALIYLGARTHRDIDPHLWQAIDEKLRSRTPSQTDIDSVIFLFRCQLRGECPHQPQELFDAFTAGLTTAPGNVYLLGAYADFAYLEMRDAALAERVSREVVASKPQVPVYRSNLIRLLIVTHQFDKAQTELAALQQLDKLGSIDAMIAGLETELEAATNAAAAPAK